MPCSHRLSAGRELHGLQSRTVLWESLDAVSVVQAPVSVQKSHFLRGAHVEDVQVVAMLVRRCIAGDAAAWEEIVQTYNRRIYNICYRFAGSADDAADLSQEVFIKMYRTLSTYDTTRASFMTWVTTVTRNLLVDHFRKGKYDRVTDSLDATPGNQEDGLTLAEQLEDKSASPETKLRSQETQKLVHEALKRLSPELREA